MVRVLVVDDSPSIRLLLRRRLELAGHQIIEAIDGDQALEVLSELPPEQSPDIILLDAMMPGLDGAEVLAEMTRRQLRIPVIAVSAIPDLDQDEAWKAAAGHLRKPIDFDDLLDQIERISSAPLQP